MIYRKLGNSDLNLSLIHISLDAVNISIEDAIDALLQLTGESVSDVVVDEVFSKFCVGK